MSRAKEYRLFICDYSRENEEKFSQYRFCRITSAYILIYSDSDLSKEMGIKEVSSENVPILPFEDKVWLLESNSILVAEDAKEREKEITKNATKALEKLSKELEKARKM